MDAPESIRASLNRKALASARQRAALSRLLGLQESDVLAIQHLAHAGRLTSTQLGSLLGLSSGGVTALVHRLERAGCVARAPNPRDRRSTLLRLTPAIERRAGEALAPLVAELDALIGRLGADERRAIDAFLAGVAEISERHADELARRADDSERPDVGARIPALWA
jgi:DNA-binding MarR family transcriptional regulator